MQNFGETIKSFRKSAELTQTQFAEKVGVHLQTISKWERGLLIPDFSLLGEIAAALSIPLETLLGLQESEQTFTGTFNMAAFGKALSEARRAKNQSQSELAAAVGTTADNISKWERGVTCPDVSTFVLLSGHLEVPASKLYFGICDETEVELPVQWHRRKKLRLLWLGCAVVPLLIVIAVLSVLLVRAPQRDIVKTQFGIDYWLCGGSFRTDVPYTIREEDGEVTLAIPQKEGSEFLGWYLTPDYSGDAVTSIVCTGEDISLYAKWDTLSFDVRYELSGGVLARDNPAHVTAETSLPLNDPARRGYLFLGWFDSPDGGLQYERVGGAGAKNLTLYALWKKCDLTFTVTYELDGGVLGKENPLRLEAGAICSLNSPEKRGHEFVGWNEAADGSGEFLTEIYGISEDLTLYAIYSPKSYLVQYRYEGAYEGEQFNPNHITFGQSVSLLPVSLYGNEFLGWFTEEEGGTKIEKIDESNLPELSVLYAHFRPIPFSVFLDADGGEFEIGGKRFSRYTLAAQYGQPQELPIPTRADYIFLGWVDEMGNRVEKINIYNFNDISLTAKWRPTELHYQIRYVLDGGIQNDANPTEGISGERMYLHDPQKTGYLFLGWFDNEEGQGTRYDFIPEDRAQDIVLFAIWQEIKTVGSADYFTYEKGANAVKITGYTGPSGDNVDLAFPVVIDGLPVTEISEQTMPAIRLFHSVTIPHSVTILGTYVFCRCIVTEPLMIPSEVERIEAYSVCEFQGKIRFPEHGNLIYIGECAFSNCTFDEPLILPQGVETIGTQAFSNICADGVFLPDSVKTIADKAFWSYGRWVHDEMTDIFLPSSPIYIGREAFQLINLYTTLTAEQTKNFDPNWSLYAFKYTAEKHKVTLSDGGYTETFEDYGIILPKRKKEGFTFLGWQNGAGEVVHNCYFPSADETLVAVYEEETPTDGRVKDRATPLTAGQNYRLPYVSMQSVYFVWEGDDCTLQFSLQRGVSAYLIRGGVETKINGTCVCKKGDLFRVGGHWAQAGTTLTLTVTVT